MSRVYMQVEGHNIVPRMRHSATAFALSPEVTEVVIFGGQEQNREFSLVCPALLC